VPSRGGGAPARGAAGGAAVARPGRVAAPPIESNATKHMIHVRHDISRI
jgi:hypothetical protein